MALTPVPAYREFFTYGKVRASDVIVVSGDGKTEPFWDNCAEGEEAWMVAQRIRYEDGHEEEGTCCYLRAPATEKEAREAMQRMINFYSKSKEEMLAVMALYKNTEDDLAFIENRYPNYQLPPTGPGATDEHDLYQARLKVLAGLHPKTVELIRQADVVKDPEQKQKLGREAVQAYWAELAHYWSEEELLAWQRSNPIGTEWMRELVQVRDKPRRAIDPINYELAFNWLRRKYNLLTETELSDSIWLATLQRLMPGVLKKRRERLGLTTKRPPGPRPNSEA